MYPKNTNVPDIRPADDSKLTERDLVFYYSREHRLKKASPRVRALYENTEKPKSRLGGFFGSLVDTKPKAMLLIVIAVISVLILLFSNLNLN
ncbi:MAG: hypothetical protein LBC27_07140 [Spirochaetaceae bacterium]|jgi:hypothetical protein|nr:hypothetical protein [Spirochaetaceae bacterium]